MAVDMGVSSHPVPLEYHSGLVLLGNADGAIQEDDAKAAHRPRSPTPSKMATSAAYYSPSLESLSSDTESYHGLREPLKTIEPPYTPATRSDQNSIAPFLEINALRINPG